MKQNLTDLVVTDLHHVELQKTITAGNLNAYMDLFPEVSPEGKYLEVFKGYEVLYTETNDIMKIEPSDYLSVDGGYVYLNGAEKKIADETLQQIQTIENYLEGNDIYESEFKISFKKIAKESGIRWNGVSIAKVVYFNEDFVVLALNYKGFMVGDAGFRNVIIDLQEDKKNPTAYIVDLGIS